jgi:hypothetical protein
MDWSWGYEHIAAKITYLYQLRMLFMGFVKVSHHVPSTTKNVQN